MSKSKPRPLDEPNMSKSKPRPLDEPNMSDRLLLVTVEDLIYSAMGPKEVNTVNFKILRNILILLARQLRLLQQKVDIVDEEISEDSVSWEQARRPTREGKHTEEINGAESNFKKDTRAIKKGERARNEKGSGKITENRRASGEKIRAGIGKAEKRKDQDEKGTLKDGHKSAKDKRNRDEERADDRGLYKVDKEKVDKDESRKIAKYIEGKGKSQERLRADKGKIKITGKDKEGEDMPRKDKQEGSKRSEKDRLEKEKDNLGKGKEYKGGERRGGKERDHAGRDEDGSHGKYADDKGKSGKYASDRQTYEDKDTHEGEKDIRGRRKDRVGVEKYQTHAGKDGKERAGARVTGTGQHYSDTSARVGSIEMVTQSEFRRVEEIVKALQEITGPIPLPTFPDNKKLREDIAKGTATLTESMEAMQVVSRVEAAEAAVGRLADILTRLAASGALPEDIAGRAAQIRADVMQLAQGKTDAKGTHLKGPGPGAKRTDPKGKYSKETVAKGEKTSNSADSPKMERQPTSATSPTSKSVVIDTSERAKNSQQRLPAWKMSSSRQAELTARQAAASRSAGWAEDGNVTFQDMDRALRLLRSDMNEQMENLTARATALAETAFANIKMISKKMAACEELNNKLSKLYELVTDYSEQLSGLDGGLTVQLQGFKDIMSIMREDMKNGLNQLEQVNNNAETTALKELMERHQEMVLRLDETLHLHQGLSAHQKELGEQLRGLVACLEALREQKADCEEVYDGLRDKADLSRLAGMLTGEEFENVRRQLDGRLDLCIDKFNRQDQTWMGALAELALIVDEKASYLDLLGARDELQSRLREIQHAIHLLTERIGDPKAAVLMRKLASGASCAVCKVPALMEPADAARGAPIRLPAARPAPLGAPAAAEPVELCLKPMKIDQTGDTHFCRRWCGSSHTLLTDSVAREKADLTLRHAPARRYIGFGSDGKCYRFEEELAPCEECNRLLQHEDRERSGAPSGDGAGDQGTRHVSGSDHNESGVFEVQERRVTVFDDNIRCIAVHEDSIRRSSAADREVKLSRATSRQIMATMGSEDPTQSRGTMVGINLRGWPTVVDEEVVQRMAVAQDIADRRAAGGQEQVK